MECVCLWVCLNFGVQISACRLSLVYNDTTTAAKLRGLFEGGAGQLVQNVLFLRRLLRQLRVQLPDHHATHTVTGRQQSRSANTNTHTWKTCHAAKRFTTSSSLSLSLRFNGHFLRGPGTVCRRNWSLLHWHCSSSATDSRLYCSFIATRERCHHDFVIRSCEHKLIL